MAYLKTLGGLEAGQVKELRAPRTLLGRHPDCEIAVEQLDASRRHAQIVFLNNEAFLEDLHSRNGTFLNEQRIDDRKKLSPGDRIRISGTVFEFHPSESSSDADTPPVVIEEDRSSRVLVVAGRDVSTGPEPSQSSWIVRAELSALLEITRNLRSTLALDNVLPQVLDTLFGIFPAAERGLVVLADEDGGLVPRWVKLRQAETDRQIHVSSTIVNRVMKTQQAVISADAAEDARFDNSSSLGEPPIRSVMCAPLVDGAGKSFGVLELDTLRLRDRFQEQDLRVLMAVATQASIAIDNARLHERALFDRDIERDLELADEIQRSFLPAQPPEVPGYEFFDFYRPAAYVGGDFYDYLTLPDGRLAIVIGDVVGHGLAAAMLTAKLAGEVRYRLLTTSRPADVLTGLNTTLPRGLSMHHFVTLVLAVLDPQTGELTLVNAGHPPPLLRLPDGQVADVTYEGSGAALGLIDDAVYEQHSLAVPRGGLLLLYTDGINEAMNVQKECYGTDRVRQHVREISGGPQRLGQHLIGDVRRFAQGSSQADDMCVVCFGRHA